MDNHGKLMLEEAIHRCTMLLRLLKMIPFLTVQMLHAVTITISMKKVGVHLQSSLVLYYFSKIKSHFGVVQIFELRMVGGAHKGHLFASLKKRENPPFFIAKVGLTNQFISTVHSSIVRKWSSKEGLQ